MWLILICILTVSETSVHQSIVALTTVLYVNQLSDLGISELPSAMNIFSDDFASYGALKKPMTLDEVIIKVTDMVSWDSQAQKLAKAAGLNVNMVSWEGLSNSHNTCSYRPYIYILSLTF